MVVKESRSRPARFARMVQNAKEVDDEIARCLRAQARAWRQMAFIGLTDPDFVRQNAAMLLFNTVPFVNIDYVERFADETLDRAEKSAIASGVLSAPEPRP